MKIYTTIAILTLTCMVLSIFLYYQISQDRCYIDDAPVGQFVVGITSEYCYAIGQEPKHLKIQKVFHTLEECKEYLSLRQ